MTDIAAQTDPVIERVVAMLPENFPEHISRPVFEGMRKQAAKLEQFLSAEETS